ncbi:DegT/DnrJ/EryC1/StrS family aminotransferase [Patescibacteria group bacterium]|nr:DegT/DnrJ/EryC1/StrS family aminotransferase [Patescibacteria group bacterium]
MNKAKQQIGVGGIVLGKKEKEYLAQVIASNRLSYGPFSKKFEQKFAKAHGTRFGLFMNSGTSALQVALAALKEKYQWRDGDEVLVPAATFIATSNVILQNNLTPVFVDVDKATYNIDPSLIEKKITKRTRCIIPVHLFGLPCDMKPIMTIAKRHNLRVLEDSCETMFAKDHGKSVGSFGDIACFSTYVAHLIVTGVGGLAVTNNKELAVIMRSIMNHGRDNIYISIDDDKKKKAGELQEIVRKRFSFIRMGYSYRNTELEAAIALGQLERTQELSKKRKEHAHSFLESLKDLSKYLQLPIIPKGKTHSFMMFPILVKNGKKDKLVQFLEERNIETRDMPTLLNQPFYKKVFGSKLASYPVCKKMVESGFYIGCHPYMSKKEQVFVTQTIHDFYA